MGVPLKDGEAQRVGRPSLNHDDAQLAEALREVAAIARSSERAIPQLPPVFDRTGDARETREVHMPPPKAISADPLPPAERIDPPKPKSHPALPPVDAEADFQADTAEETLFSHVPLEHLASLARLEDPEEDEREPVRRTEDGQFQWTNAVPWKLWLAFIAVGFTALVTGFLLGRWDQEIKPASDSDATPQTDQQSSAPAPEGISEMLGRLGRPAVKGKVEFSQGQGSAIQPDAGAWIFAFPAENPSSAKIPAEFFESESSNLKPALQAMGGNAVQADAQGNFELSLLNPGTYLILIRSQHKTSSTARTPSEVLNQYFENPEAFLKIRAFQEKELEFPAQAGELELETF